MGSMLEGRVAGYGDGKIRGVTSMNGLTTPLYVIDGFPVEKTTNDGYGNWIESVPDLNMEDIESINCLKGCCSYFYLWSTCSEWSSGDYYQTG